ncbi:MAG: hypothetical protein LBS31_00640 [Candidatus Adiutrix sp.]|nr:hypothetical protein [Candidatus Adiutrix sp.]
MFFCAAVQPESKPPARGRLRRALPAAAVLLVLAFYFGPGWTLRHFLGSAALAGDSGPEFTFEKAGGSLFSRSAYVENLCLVRLNGASLAAPVCFDSVRAEGLCLISLFKLWREDGGHSRTRALPLARRLAVAGLKTDGGPMTLSLGEAIVEAPALPPSSGDPGLTAPLLFDKLLARNFFYGAEAGLGSFDRLEARGLTLTRLGSLQMRGFNADLGGEAGAVAAADLTIGGLDINLMALALTRGDFLSFLRGCETLDLAQAVYTKNGQEALTVMNALFDRQEPADGSGGQAAKYIRRISLRADLAALAPESGAQYWRRPDLAAIWAITNGALNLEAELELTRDAKAGTLELDQLRLSSPDLGQAVLRGRAVGVSSTRSWQALNGRDLSLQKLMPALSELATWRLAGLSLEFSDQGLAAALYRHLDRTEFRDAPSRSSPANIMSRYIAPTADKLEEEGGLANIPALINEIAAFINQPDSFKITAAPLKPLSLKRMLLMRFVYNDKYDTIDKLRLTLQVNNRAPVSVATAPGVAYEKLPSSPQPLDDFFKEEDLPPPAH